MNDQTKNDTRGFFDAHSGMPPWVPALLLQIVGLVILLFALFHVARALRGFLVLLLISLFLSIAFEPAVTFLETRFGFRRGLGTGLVFLVAGVASTVVIVLMVPVVSSQISNLASDLPGYSRQVSEFLERFNIEVSQDRILEAIGGSDLTSTLAGRALGVGSVVIGTVFQLLTIGLFTFYLTADAPRIRRAILRVLPERRQREVSRIQQIAIEKTGGYVYSRLLLAIFAAGTTWIALRIIGVEFAEPLAIWVGLVSQFVPVIGTYLGGLAPILIALLDNPVKALWVVIFIVLYQQFENIVISPRITERTMSLHPAVSFGAAIVGATLLGGPGALMALPVAATVQAWISSFLEERDATRAIDDLAGTASAG